ncbi:Hypothetical_protein [Hexamita inflata]|uniref:Hypothetical_protein n=1 Tax=Hexamita inflata TaxID=28002 RepID=A0AA86PSN7_9EUKA|nr:Hypothetical protein HINF_LOCUS33094 [Hexamita inflata]
MKTICALAVGSSYYFYPQIKNVYQTFKINKKEILAPYNQPTVSIDSNLIYANNQVTKQASLIREMYPTEKIVIVDNTNQKQILQSIGTQLFKNSAVKSKPQKGVYIGKNSADHFAEIPEDLELKQNKIEFIEKQIQQLNESQRVGQAFIVKPRGKVVDYLNILAQQ